MGNAPGLGSKPIRQAGDAVVEARADGNQEVAILDGVVRTGETLTLSNEGTDQAISVVVTGMPR